MSRLHRQKIKQRRHDHNQVDNTAAAPVVVEVQAPVAEKDTGLYMPDVDEAFDKGYAAGLEAAKNAAKKKTGARAKRSSSTRR